MSTQVNHGSTPSEALASANKGDGWRGGVRHYGPSVLAAAVVFAAYFYLRPPTSVGGHHEYRTWSYAHLAYSDIAALYASHSLANHAFPYVHTAIEYPVLTGIYMWTAAWFGGFQGYFLASAVGIAICAALTAAMLRSMTPRAAWLFAGSPILFVYSLLNWDLLAIALMVGGIYYFRKGAYLTSGILFSLGTSAKLFPVIALIFFALELYKDRHDPASQRAVKRLLLGALGAGVLVNLPFVLLNFRGWFYFFDFNYARSGGGGLLGRIPFLNRLPVSELDLVEAVVLVSALVWLGRKQWRGLSAEEAAAGAMAVFMLLNKTYSPQYVLWISTLVLIAGWPYWIFAVLSVMGISDYGSAFVTMHLEQSDSPQLGWYVHEVGPKFLDVRLSAIACALVPLFSRSKAARVQESPSRCLPQPDVRPK